MPLASDANVGLTFSSSGRARLIRVLDAFAMALPEASSLLIDKAGRIVETARKPLGINLEAICALAAGVHASTHELASSMGEEDFALLFEHTDDRQVFVWPVADRAMLVILLKGTGAMEKITQEMEGRLGEELVAVVKEAREPLRVVPPPRIDVPDIPNALGEQMRALTMHIMELQAKHAGKFTFDANTRLLRHREDLIQALTLKDWDRAGAVCNATTEWLKSLMPET
jgi:predicted regulator of Ras-like GTPase activity (Roadblock/LC7/MglB family)